MSRESDREFRLIERFLTRAQRAGHQTLTEPETKRMLALAGVHVPIEGVATSAAHAIRLAKKIGFPVVLKVVSRDVMHKTEMGGVELDLCSSEAVRRAYRSIVTRVGRAAKEARIDGVLVQPHLKGREVLVGATQDPQLGPVLVFGLGGTAVELLGDVVFRLAPIAERDAWEMVGEIRTAPLLNGYRGGAAVSVEAIVRALVNLSRLISRFPHVIREIEINPLLVSPDGAVAVDATAVIAGSGHA